MELYVMYEEDVSTAPKSITEETEISHTQVLQMMTQPYVNMHITLDQR